MTMLLYRYEDGASK